MGALSPTHMVIILVVALLILGPGKLPETGEALGKAVREFRRAMADELQPTQPAAAAVSPPSGAEAAEAGTVSLAADPDAGRQA